MNHVYVYITHDDQKMPFQEIQVSEDSFIVYMPNPINTYSFDEINILVSFKERYPDTTITTKMGESYQTTMKNGNPTELPSVDTICSKFDAIEKFIESHTESEESKLPALGCLCMANSGYCPAG
jgi:hypothetical protein